MTNKSVIYLNYSPYENSGHILDYLLENFERVYLFSIAFHTLGNNVQYNKLTIYQKGKVIKEEYMHYLRVPEALVFFFIPVRSTLNALQIIKRIFSIKQKYGKIDVYFTVNAFTASVGRLLKWLGVVKQTVFWVWDYYPPTHPSAFANCMRWLYWQFDKFATYSDKVVYLHKRLADVRRAKGVIDPKTKTIVVPIGTGEILPIKKKNLSEIKIGFIGVLKKSQGLEMLIGSGEHLSQHFKKVIFEIVGAGPDSELFQSMAKNSKKVKYNFYGLTDEKKYEKILYNSTIGVAPYKPGEGTVSKYTDPGKPKRYLESNLPVLTTNVIEFAKELEEYKAGATINYGDSKSFSEGVKRILKNYDSYVRGVIKLHKKYYYKEIYKKLFDL